MVLFIQYTIGFAILIFALYNSVLAFTTGLAGIVNLFIAVGAGLVSFILLRDLFFKPIDNRVERFFFPEGFDNGSDFSEVDTLIYRQDFDGALRVLDEYLKDRPDSSMGHYKKCSLLYDYFKKPLAAVEAGCEGLSLVKLSEDDDKLIFLTLDILLEINEKEQAHSLVQQLLQNINNPALKSRLKARSMHLG